MGVGIAGIDAKRLALRGDGFVELASIAQSRAKDGMRRREVGLDADGLATRRNRLVEFGLIAQHDAEVGQIDGIACIPPQSRLDQFDRHAELPALMRDQPEQMQRVRVVGLGRQDFPVTIFSLGKTSGLVVRDAGLQKFQGARLGGFVLQLGIGAAFAAIYGAYAQKIASPRARTPAVKIQQVTKRAIDAKKSRRTNMRSKSDKRVAPNYVTAKNQEEKLKDYPNVDLVWIDRRTKRRDTMATNMTDRLWSLEKLVERTSS